MTLMVELGKGDRTCSVTGERLRDGAARINCSTSLPNYRAITAVTPHMLRQAGGGDAIPFDEAISLKEKAKIRQQFRDIEREDSYRR